MKLLWHVSCHSERRLRVLEGHLVARDSHVGELAALHWQLDLREHSGQLSERRGGRAEENRRRDQRARCRVPVRDDRSEAFGAAGAHDAQANARLSPSPSSKDRSIGRDSRTAVHPTPAEARVPRVPTGQTGRECAAARHG